MESFHASERTPNLPSEELSLEETNGIQIELMSRTQVNPDDWVLRYSAEFRTLLRDEPDLKERYRKDKEECLTYIPEALNRRVIH